MTLSAWARPADVLLADGRIAVIRPLLPGDGEALFALHENASDDSIRMRFFATSRQASRTYAEHLMAGGPNTLTMVALVEGELVAAASAEVLSPDRAEAAFLVADSARGIGIGSLLLEHLAAACHDRGIARLSATVLSENSGMIRVFNDAGFPLVRKPDGTVYEFEISTTATPGSLRAADDREFHAEARSLEPLLYPRTVAVVGVRRDGSGIGRAVLRSITAAGFAGRLFVVHPTVAEIDGRRSVPDLGSLPEPPDLVVVAVPASGTVDVLRQAAEARARSAVVLSTGFEEPGAEAARLQRELVQVARDHSIRLVGPDSLGILCNAPEVRLNATFTQALPAPGGLAIASQSGGVGIVMLDLAQRLGLGVRSFISLGGKADVSGNDLLAAWWDDEGVTAAAFYLESFGNAPKFARLARRFAERKPLLAVVGGSASGPYVAVEALFAQAGVLACHSAESMARAALVLTGQPLPAGPRLGVISNAGGMGILAADSAGRHGLVVPAFSPRLAKRIQRLVSGTVGTTNPVDLGAGVSPKTVRAVVSAVLSSGEVDALLVPVVATSLGDPTTLARCVAESRAAHPDIPVVLVPMGGLEVDPAELPGVTVLDSPDAAVEALGLAARRAAWLREPATVADPPDEERSAAARELARDVLDRWGDPDCWLGTDVTARLLTPYGLAPVGDLARGRKDAAAKAAALGFPVAVKVADPEVVHKTDRGLVRTGVNDRAGVVEALRAFRAELQKEHVPVLVQPMVSGVEVALGVVRDPGFGPLVLVAAGGVATNVWNDRVFLLPPVSPQDAARALRSLRIWPLLKGYGASPPADVDDLVRRIVALGTLVQELPELAELELNPVMATPAGSVVVDAKVSLAPAAVVDAGIPRRLRARPTA